MSVKNSCINSKIFREVRGVKFHSNSYWPICSESRHLYIYFWYLHILIYAYTYHIHTYPLPCFKAHIAYGLLIRFSVVWFVLRICPVEYNTIAEFHTSFRNARWHKIRYLIISDSILFPYDYSLTQGTCYNAHQVCFTAIFMHHVSKEAQLVRTSIN